MTINTKQLFRSNDSWQRGREISVEKYDKHYKADPLIMSETSIGSQIADPNQKFIYEYDFNKLAFHGRADPGRKEENGKLEYPVCVRKEGLAPSQYGTKGLVDKRLAEMEEKYDLQPDALKEGYGSEGDGVEEETEESDELTDDSNAGNDGF